MPGRVAYADDRRRANLVGMERHLFVIAVLAMTACSGRLDSAASNVTSGASADGGGASSGDGGSGGGDGSQPGPYRITCSVYHRDVQSGQAQHVRESIVFTTDSPEEKAIELPGRGIPVHAKLAPAPDASDLVDLTITFPQSGLKREIRLARDVRPPYELFGEHGFSGLNYVTTPGSNVDVQFICEASARDEERPRPPTGPGSIGGPPPGRLPPPPPPVPFRLRCELSDGQSLLLEGATERSVTVGEHTFELALHDDRYEGRGFIVRAPGRIQQLYQLDPTRADVDLTRGPGGLTGRTVLEPLTDAGPTSSASIACGAAKD